MVARIDVVRTAYEGLIEQIAGLDAQIAELSRQEAIKATDLRARKALLAERVRDAYNEDRTSLLETFLSADSFTDVLSQVSYLVDVGQQDKALAQQIARGPGDPRGDPPDDRQHPRRDRIPAGRDGSPEEGAGRPASRGTQDHPGSAQDARGRDRGRARQAALGVLQGLEEQGCSRTRPRPGPGGTPDAREGDRQARRRAVPARQHPVPVQRHAHLAGGDAGAQK